MTLPTSETLQERSTSQPEAAPRTRSVPNRRVTPPPVPPLVVADGPLEMDVARRRWESVYGMLCSLGVHLVMLLVLGLLAFETSSREIGTLVGVLGQQQKDAPADFILDSEMDVDTGGSEEPLDAVTSTVLFNDSGLLAANPARVGGGGTGTGDGAGDGDGVGVAVPTLNIPGYAVTKGSFSAWTEPEDPEPGKEYFIIIQVRVPDKMQKGKLYPVKDITGLVTGTDGYKKVIRFRPTDKVEIQEGVIQFQLQIPGAAQLVKDTIRIESRLLKEKQTIQLVF